MPTYNFFITVSSPTPITDLELEDVCLHFIDCLDHPVAERVDGTYGSADYSFDAYTVEVYEESGDRVWLYTLNAHDPMAADRDHDGFVEPPKEAPPSWLRWLFRRE